VVFVYYGRSVDDACSSQYVLVLLSLLFLVCCSRWYGSVNQHVRWLQARRVYILKLKCRSQRSTNWVLYRYYEDLQPIVSGVGPNIALSSQLNAYNFWQTICVTTQSTSQHGLRRAGVCDLLDFNDPLWDSLPLFHLANDVMTYVCPKSK